MTETAAKIDMEISNNATWADSFTFGETGDTSWNFSNKTFKMDVKRSRYDDTPLFTLSTGNGRIVVDDVIERVLHFHVPDPDFSAILIVGTYEYDLIMKDEDDVETRIMSGCVKVCQGVTEH